MTTGNASRILTGDPAVVAYQAGVADERERIRQLAIEHNALYRVIVDPTVTQVTESYAVGPAVKYVPFADLIGGEK